MPEDSELKSPATELSVGGGLIQEPLAIVAVACKLPGADDMVAFWDLLKNGRSAVGPLPEEIVPRQRFLDTERKKRATTYSDVGAIVTRDEIDHEYLGISAEEAAEWDECHLRFAQVAKSAWEQMLVNCSANAVASKYSERCGIYIGHSGGAGVSGELVYATMASATASYLDDAPYFQSLPQDAQASIKQLFQKAMERGRPNRHDGSSPHVDANAIARLVAKLLDVQGPQIVIESACASSLVALGLAGVALNAGQIDAAIVGGASYNKVDSLILFSQAHSCSATDSRPFDDAADGLISSEGFVTLVVRRLADAVRDGDKIEGVITGIGMASDGRGKSLWAPRREGQIESMRRAYRDEAQLQRLQYLEAHATSTQVGDATETSALAEFYGAKLNGRRLPIGSVKSNIGHTLETAGLAGLTKTLLSMQHEMLVPSINFEKPNTTIDWNQVPFDVLTECKLWPAPSDGSPRTAGVNAFGIGGLNVHVVLEQYEPKFHQALSNTKPSPSINGRRSSSVSERIAEPIAIVGMGCVLPGALRGTELERLVKGDEVYVRPPLAQRWPAALPRAYQTDLGSEFDFQAGYIDDFEFDWRKNRVPPKQVQNANPLQFMLLQAAGEALEASGILGDSELRNRASVVVGTVFGGEFGHGLQIGLRLQNAREELREVCKRLGYSSVATEKQLDEFEQALLNRLPALLDETGSFTSSTLASRITKHFNLMGGAFALDAAGQSSAHAVNIAMQILRTGAVDSVVCAAGTRSLDYYSFARYMTANLLPGQQNSLAELWPAEGVVAITLQRQSFAEQRQAKVLGLIDAVTFETESQEKLSLSTPATKVLEQLERRIGKIASAEALIGIAADIAAAGDARSAATVRELTSTCERNVRSTVRYTVRGDRHKEVTSGIDSSMIRPVKAASASNPIELGSKKSSTFYQSRLETVGCFPGQGSQSPAILAQPLMQTDAAVALIKHFDEILRSLESESFVNLLRKMDGPPAQVTWPIQASMFISDLAYAASLQANGCRFDAVLGHSLGELAAMVVAGIWSPENALRFVHARAQSVLSCSQSLPSGLVSVSASSDKVEKICSRTLSSLTITHRNAPNQTIVGGCLSDLDTFQTALKEERIACIRLPVPAAFHSPILTAAKLNLIDFANTLELQPPRIPFYSTVSGQFVADPEQIRRNLVEQLVTPIDFVRDTKRLCSMGVRKFVEVGPGEILCKLITLNAEGSEISVVHADNLHLQPASAVTSTNKSRGSVQQTVPSSPAKTADVKAAQHETSRHDSARSRLIDATSTRRTEMRAKSALTNVRKPVDKSRSDEAAVAATAPEPKAPQSTPHELVYVPTNGSLQNLANGHAVTANELPSREDLEQFVIDFIVEHTGYPLEMIEPHWDLEAELGVDSIKQVQLFGELRQTYDLDTTRFRGITVRSIADICDVILEQGTPSEVANFVSQVESHKKTSDLTTRESLPKPAIKNGFQFPFTSATGVGSVQQPEVAINSLNNIAAPVVSAKELGEFMVDFVVEHTGYPRDMVDLNAELESDLGLDSIKLAQLIGEVRSSFEFELTLEDRKSFINCRTLQDIIDHLSTKIANGSNTAVLAVDSVQPRLESSNGSPVAAKKKEPSRDAERALVHNVRDVAPEGASLREKTHLSSVVVAKADSLSHVRNDMKLSDATISKMRGVVQTANTFTAERQFRARFFREANPSEQGISDLRDEKPTNLERSRPAKASKPRAEGVTQRYVLSTQLKAPHENVGQPRFYGRAVIVGENEFADELLTRLANAGIETLHLPEVDAERWPEILEKEWAKSPLPHLFITTPHDANAQTVASSEWWSQRRGIGVNSVFWLCQRWLSLVLGSNLSQDCSLVATPNLGGEFAFGSAPIAIEGGAISGLVKAMIIECWMAGHRRLAFKLIDLGKLPRVKAVDSIFQELAYGSYDTEVSYTPKGRAVVRAVAQEAKGRADMLPKPKDRWICTGGARGITAFVAERLALRYQLELHLVGVTKLMDLPEDWKSLDESGMRSLKIQVMQHARANAEHYSGRNPLKVWQDVEKTLEIEETLKRMRSLGIQVEYHACDCADATALQAVLNDVKANYGPIHGVLHGAGIGQDARFDRKLPLKVKQCFSAKMDGALNLIEATSDQPLTHFIGFGSISGRFGANGHTDYSGANDGLSKITDWLKWQRPSVRSIAFHWHAWGDIGMATKPETKLALESIGMQFMPAEEGLQHLIREIESAENESEVLITDDRYHRAFYPAETLEQEGNIARTSHQHALIDIDALHSIVQGKSVEQTVEATLLPTSDPFLIEHRLNDRPLLPAVVGLELIVESAMQHSYSLSVRRGEQASSCGFERMYPIGITGLQIHAPFKFFCDEPHKVRIQSTSTSGKRSLQVQLAGDALNRSGIVVGKNRTLCDCKLKFNIQPLEQLEFGSAFSANDLKWHHPQWSQPEDAFYSGAPFRLIQRFALSDTGMLAEMVAPSLIELAGLNRNAVGWRVPSAILDSALYAAGILSYLTVKPSVCLPMAFEQLFINHMPRPGERLLTFVRMVSHAEDHACFDFDVRSDSGTLYLAARSYRTAFVH